MNKKIINNTKIKVVENMSKVRMTNMNNNFINSLAGAIMSPVVDRISKRVSVEEIRNLYNLLESMYENNQTGAVFDYLNIIIKLSRVSLPHEYYYILDNNELRDEFVEEAMADLEDILLDYE